MVQSASWPASPLPSPRGPAYLWHRAGRSRSLRAPSSATRPPSPPHCSRCWVEESTRQAGGQQAKHLCPLANLLFSTERLKPHLLYEPKKPCCRPTQGGGLGSRGGRVGVRGRSPLVLTPAWGWVGRVGLKCLLQGSSKNSGFIGSGTLGEKPKTMNAGGRESLSWNEIRTSSCACLALSLVTG